jgi:hypothetical protein
MQSALLVLDGESLVCLDLVSGRKEWRLMGVTSFALNPTATMIAAGQVNGDLVLVEPFTGRVLQKIVFHTGVVTSVCFGPDGATVGSRSEDGSAQVVLLPQCLSLWQQSEDVGGIGFVGDSEILLVTPTHALRSMNLTMPGEAKTSGAPDSAAVWESWAKEECSVLKSYALIQSGGAESIAFLKKKLAVASHETVQQLVEGLAAESIERRDEVTVRLEELGGACYTQLVEALGRAQPGSMLRRELEAVLARIGGPVPKARGSLQRLRALSSLVYLEPSSAGEVARRAGCSSPAERDIVERIEARSRP